LLFFFAIRFRLKHPKINSEAVTDEIVMDEEPKIDIPPPSPSIYTGFTCVNDVGFSFDQNALFRKTMEDEHVVVNEFAGNKDQAFFGVYDGHGGRKAVDLVKDHLHKNFEKGIKGITNFQFEEALKNAFLETDQNIVEELNPQKDKSGSTAAVAIVTKTKEHRWLHTANIGDARVILCRKNVATRLTFDHKATDEGEVKRITDLGGLVFMNKVAGTLAVSRAFGDSELKPWVSAEPYLSRVELISDDSVLILACDGLFDVAEDQAVIDFIKGDLGTLTAQQLAEKLVKFALDQPTRDNISVIVVKL